MLRNVLSVLFTVLLLALTAVACGRGDQPVETSGPVVVATAHPSATFTAVPASPRSTALPTGPGGMTVVPTDEPTPTVTAPATTIPPTTTPMPTLQPSNTPPVTAANPAAIRLELELVAGGLDVPVGMAHAGDGSGRLFVLEKVGRIRVVRDSSLLDVPFLDISDRVGSTQNEQGLLGLAFHPDYARNGFLFVYYTDTRGDTVVSRFLSGPERADPASELVLLTVDQPAGNHNGGHLAFGPDGYLYVGTGDGGGAGDQYGNGQNGQTLLGALLRLDVDQSQPYAIPAGNPFVSDPTVRDEIWAIGLRNPWRYSFDRLTGDLYIADVGQNVYEEVNFQAASSPGGQNYGWPIMEGVHCFPASESCDQAGLTLPVVEYDHSQGCSVTGGYVYRGQAFPLLAGIYVFGDFCSGRIWGLALAESGSWEVAQLAQANANPSSFGEDESGELYLLDMAHGELLRISAYPK